MQCGDGCTGSPYAFMKYDCGGCGETCGPGFCTACGHAKCTCGDNVGCGSGCNGACGGSCSGGCNGCNGNWAGWNSAKADCSGCAECAPPRCWLVRALCECTGCGELYWNEWYNDPPSCAEPCDCYGNWVGPGHGGYYVAPYSVGGAYMVGEGGASPPPLEMADEAAPIDTAPAPEGAVARPTTIRISIRICSRACLCATAGSSSSVKRVPGVHCWASQQWHPRVALPLGGARR